MFWKKYILEINGNKRCDVDETMPQRKNNVIKLKAVQWKKKKFIYWFIFALFYLLIYLLFIFLDKQGKINPSTSQR